MRRPVTSHDPRAPLGRPPSSTTLASVMLSDADPFIMPCPRPPVAVLDDEQRRQAIAVLHAEAAGGELEALDRLGIEGAGEAEKAIRVVDFHAVHHREVLVGRAAAHRDAGCRTPRSPATPGSVLQRAIHVVERAWRAQHLHRRDRRGRRRCRWRRRDDGHARAVNPASRASASSADVTSAVARRRARSSSGKCPAAVTTIVDLDLASRYAQR